MGEALVQGDHQYILVFSMAFNLIDTSSKARIANKFGYLPHLS